MPAPPIMSATAPTSKTARSGVVVPQRPNLLQRLAARLIHLLLRAVSLTIRYEWRDHTGVIAERPAEPAIFCVWHNRLALGLEIYNFYSRRIGRRCQLAAMVSASKDGGLLARVLEHYGVQPVRGSTSRRGRQALRELTTWARRGYDLAITPDGPRGPGYVIQDGVTSLAQLTGLPIIPVTYTLGWKITLGSWDRFQIPLPFSRCIVHMEAPLAVPREASDTEREALRARLRETMLQATVDE